jgi:hypothetical protein
MPVLKPQKIPKKVLYRLRMIGKTLSMNKIYGYLTTFSLSLETWNSGKQARTRLFRMPALLGVLLCAAGLLAIPGKTQAAKPYPVGIMDLPGKVTAKKPIGTIDDHPWLNVNVDGLRIRIGWSEVETADNVYNWPLIDDCLALARTSGKFIGLGVAGGLSAPPWLMGGVTFADGSTTLNVATLTSQTTNAFLASDVGRVIVCDNFPPGTKIVSRTSGTMVQTSAAATKTATTNRPVAFSILARNPGGAEFRVLTAPDQGVMVVPWDPIAKAKWKEFVVALGARYDRNPQLGYLVMAGFQQGFECYLAGVQADIDFFNASAIRAGYTGNETLPAGLVAWEATAQEIINQYMISFPRTPLITTLARPYPEEEGGTTAMNDIVFWGIAEYPGRFGLMNSQLHATSGIGYYANARIYENRFTEPTGIQFICDSTTPENVARLSNSPPYGDDPLLTPFRAVNTSFTAGISIGAKFIETYEKDVINPAYQTMLATQRAALLEGPPP